MRGAIFDVDGTLIDSMSMWMHFGSDFVRSFGIDAGRELDWKIRYFSLRETAQYLSATYPVLGSADDIEEMCRRKTVKFYYEEVNLKPGARELLDALCDSGVKLYIATATYRQLIEGALRRLEIWDKFSGALTCAEVGSGKDKPDIFLAARAALGTETDETWVFEDAMHAMKTAKSCGFKVCGVYDDSEADHKKEISEICDVYVNSFEELDISRLI